MVKINYISVRKCPNPGITVVLLSEEDGLKRMEKEKETKVKEERCRRNDKT